MNYVNFDIETYSPSKSNKIDVNEFRVSVLGAYFSWTDEYVAFLEEDLSDFIKILKDVDLVVGFNHVWFDLPVLQKYSGFNLKKIPTYDILTEFEKKVGHKIKLNDLCKANLNIVKTDSYENFRHYYEDKKWFELIDYCMHDVLLTEKLFKKILNRQKLEYFELHQKLSVELDYPTPQKLEATLEMDSIF